MNNELVKLEIKNIISDKVNAAWRQYPAGVAQKKELTELGIIDLMPEGFAFTDAKVVLEALDEKTISGFDADGEGFADTAQSTLKSLIEQVDETQSTDETDYDENTAYFYSDEQQAIEDEIDELIEAATVEENDSNYFQVTIEDKLTGHQNTCKTVTKPKDLKNIINISRSLNDKVVETTTDFFYYHGFYSQHRAEITFNHDMFSGMNVYNRSTSEVKATVGYVNLGAMNISPSIAKTGNRDTLGQEIYSHNGVDFVIWMQNGSVSNQGTIILDKPETEQFPSSALEISYKQRRTMPWLID